jgi:hypothetical protein
VAELQKDLKYGEYHESLKHILSSEVRVNVGCMPGTGLQLVVVQGGQSALSLLGRHTA